MTDNNLEMTRVADAIRNSKHPLVLGHVNPDADCIASALVMHSALLNMGKKSTVLMPRKTISEKFAFLIDLIPADLDSTTSLNGQTDLAIAVDTALHKRLNLPADFALPEKATLCNVDHHLGNERYARLNWIDPTAASASQMVFALLEHLDVNITAKQATLLYAGLHGDTLGFSLQGTEAPALSTGAKLAKLGANIAWVCQNLYRTLSPSDFRLMQIVYANTRLDASERIAWSSVSYDELTAAGCSPSDIDEQVAVPRSIAGVNMAILFSVPKPGKVRINLRSEDDINILPFAKSIGGGGHAQAAGVIMDGELTPTVDAIVAKAQAYLDNHKNAVDDKEA